MRGWANFTGYFILMDAFSVSSAWESTRASHPSVYWWKYVWNKWVHPKAGSSPWNLVYLTRSCKSLLSPSCNLSRILREGNKVADSLASFAHAHRDSMVFYSEDKFPTCCKKFQSCGPARTVSDLNKDAGASLPRLKCRKEASAQQTMNLWVPCLVRRPVPSSKQAGRRGTAILGLTKAGNGSAAKEVISYPLFGLSKDREARLLSVMTFPVNFHYSIVTEKPVEIDCFALLYIEESCRE
ncbi:hypothetical protein L1987_88343 [Smallanthus sonchifolius]|nr:hypothetical protein L1987_88343 [Smallanthus sonchifolius]